MAFWGWILIAAGIGSLLNIGGWPLIAIVVGVGFLVNAASGRSDRGRTMGMWSCWPTFYREREPEDRHDDRDLRHPSV